MIAPHSIQKTPGYQSQAHSILWLQVEVEKKNYIYIGKTEPLLLMWEKEWWSLQRKGLRETGEKLQGRTAEQLSSERQQLCVWQCGSEGRKTGWSTAWKKNQHLLSYHWKQQIRKVLPFDTQCFCLTSSTKDQSLRPTKGLTKDRTVGPRTSCHTGCASPLFGCFLSLSANVSTWDAYRRIQKTKGKGKKKKQNPWP